MPEISTKLLKESESTADEKTEDTFEHVSANDLQLSQ